MKLGIDKLRIICIKNNKNINQLVVVYHFVAILKEKLDDNKKRKINNLTIIYKLYIFRDNKITCRNQNKL